MEPAEPRATTELWRALAQRYEALEDTTIAELFTADAKRGHTMCAEAAGLRLDYSKNRVDEAALAELFELAHSVDLPAAIEAMFAGEKINTTENRAVLHVALRDQSGNAIFVDGEDACALAQAERERTLAFAEDVIQGEHRGYTGELIDTVVNIGIGGSDLGPRMATLALEPYWLKGRRCHFVSNVDGQELQDVLERIDHKKTLFLIASKTFTTQETMTNAHSARRWFLAQGAAEEAIQQHFAALSTNQDAVAAFGIGREQTFGFWDWVGGRYSLWSAIGLPIALQVGSEAFKAMLAGAYAMDQHFKTAPLRQNLPVLLALMGIWNRNLEKIGSHAVLPYDQRLALLPAYLQQADMESNGKSCRKDGSAVTQATAPVLFGEPGTNGQHAFYQMLHQGTDPVSCDFIAAATVHKELGDHHLKLLANFLAQPRALMQGRNEDDVLQELAASGVESEKAALLAKHRTFPGSRPSNAILMHRLEPRTLGALIALYEHKIFTQGVIWGINSFDQWGVELGKVMASSLLPLLTGTDDVDTELDSSTAELLRWIQTARADS
ncbi:MAG: glucose-6-phosphate isomerase [Pseudomonadota bacterium]